jgi:hypothetical protein
MIGARQAGGSTIVKGDNSPSNKVIVGRRPSNPPFWRTSFLPENRGFYKNSLSVIMIFLPSEKKRYPDRTPIAGRKPPGFIDSRCIPVQK